MSPACSSVYVRKYPDYVQAQSKRVQACRHACVHVSATLCLHWTRKPAQVLTCWPLCLRVSRSACCHQGAYTDPSLLLPCSLSWSSATLQQASTCMRAQTCILVSALNMRASAGTGLQGRCACARPESACCHQGAYTDPSLLLPCCTVLVHRVVQHTCRHARQPYTRQLIR